MARDNLIDFFEDFGRTRGRFTYDVHFRPRSYTYAETVTAARAFAARPQAAGIHSSEGSCFGA